MAQSTVLNEITDRIEAWFDGSLLGLSPISTLRDVDDLLAAGHLTP